MIKSNKKDFDLYIAEAIGTIKGQLQGIESDILELKNELIPLRKKVYINSVKISVASTVCVIILGAVAKWLLGLAI